MSKIGSFVKRLDKIGIKVELVGNYPWIYLSKINEQVVTEKFHANHGFTIAFEGTKPEHPDYRFTDIPKTFELIRKYVDGKNDLLPNSKRNGHCLLSSWKKER